MSDAGILVELVLVLGVVLGWGGYELYSLRRDDRRDDVPAAEAGRAPADRSGR